MLKFLGVGACFNVTMGNTSAYYKSHNKFILFDCGEEIFKKIIEQNLLDDISSVDIYITHFHSDHAGSLPSFIFYLNYILHITPNIFFPYDNLSQKNDLKNFLSACGIAEHLYHHIAITDIDDSIYIIRQDHSKYINAFGYVINLDGKWIYYGGDAGNFKIKNLEESPNKDGLYWKDKDIIISKLYIEVTKYTLSQHMNIYTLATIFKKEERKYITTMHFDDEEVISIAQKLGFDIAKIE